MDTVKAQHQQQKTGGPAAGNSDLSDLRVKMKNMTILVVVCVLVMLATLALVVVTMGQISTTSDSLKTELDTVIVDVQSKVKGDVEEALSDVQSEIFEEIRDEMSSNSASINSTIHDVVDEIEERLSDTVLDLNATIQGAVDGAIDTLIAEVKEATGLAGTTPPGLLGLAFAPTVMGVFVTLGQIVNSDTWLRVIDAALSRVNTLKAMNFTSSESFEICKEETKCSDFGELSGGFWGGTQFGKEMCEAFTGSDGLGGTVGSCSWTCHSHGSCYWYDWTGTQCYACANTPSNQNPNPYCSNDWSVGCSSMWDRCPSRFCGTLL